MGKQRNRRRSRASKAQYLGKNAGTQAILRHYRSEPEPTAESVELDIRPVSKRSNHHPNPAKRLGRVAFRTEPQDVPLQDKLQLGKTLDQLADEMLAELNKSVAEAHADIDRWAETERNWIMQRCAELKAVKG